MMKNIITLFVAGTLLVSCGEDKKEHALEKLGLTITIAGEPRIKCEEGSSLYGDNCTFYVEQKKSMIRKIDAAEFPANAEALEQVVKEEKGFKAVIEKKTLSNGAFGISWDQEKSSGKTTQNFLYYYKKGEDHYKINPLFNSDGSTFGAIIEAIGSLK